MNCRVFTDPPLISDITSSGLVVRTFGLPRDVCRALAFLHWDAGTAAVVDLHLHGLLGRDVVEYLHRRHPAVGLWGITALCPGTWPAWATDRCRRIFGTESFLRWLGGAPDTPGLCT